MKRFGLSLLFALFGLACFAGTTSSARAAVICGASPCMEDETGNDLTGFFKAFSVNAANRVLSVIFNSDVTETSEENDFLNVSFLGGCRGPCTATGETGQVIETGFNFKVGNVANRIMQLTEPDGSFSDVVGLWVDDTGNRFAITFASDPITTLPVPMPEPVTALLLVTGLSGLLGVAAVARRRR